MVDISGGNSNGSINVTTPSNLESIETLNNLAQYWSDKSQSYATSSEQSKNNSKIWAEGTDAQVIALGGTHSSKGWSEISTNANTNLSNLTATGEAHFQAPLTAGADISITNNTVSFTGTIPTVNDAILTIQKNGADIQAFTANQATNATANIIVPVNISDLADDTATNPIDKADTLTGLTATITELNYTNGVTSNVQTQLDSKQVSLGYTPANISASNFNSTGKSTISGYAMPSSRGTYLTVGATGSTYTAPANGWFTFTGYTTNASMNYIVLQNQTNYIYNQGGLGDGVGNGIGASIPAKKGDTVAIYYINVRDYSLKFVYAEGDQ